MLATSFSTRPPPGQISSVYYATRSVTNGDLEYFIDSFDSKYDKFREVYLNTKETLMGLSYRFSHYSPLDHERQLKDKADRILARWEQWFIRTLELTKGVSHLKKEFLVKKQYEVSGLEISDARKTELNNLYLNLLYQYEINEKDRGDINTAINELKLQTYGGVPGLYERLEAAERGEVHPLMRVGASMVEPPPKLTCKFS